MNAIYNFLENSSRLRTVLFWVWMLSAAGFVFFAYTQSMTVGQSFSETLQHPAIALSFLVACMSVIQSVMLKVAESENPQTVRLFGIFSVVQQILVGNLIAALVAFFLVRSLRFEDRTEQFAPQWRWALVGGMVLIGVLTLLTLIARYNQMTPGS
ncbi:hypothetical protein [Rothia sp. ZJ1223]|uniref:hypothetical protein n=1 Tax=Rothia sp. ZJ1223 TaxID=2811098 RepID=UPI0019597EE5|nr:hypothetical protein [Rothia sp. ZJ1223]MBM7051164.1 hypothetical protein [Rothia sp. ZJ1223]